MEMVLIKVVLVVGLMIWSGIELRKMNRQANEIMSESRREADGESETSEHRNAA